MKKTVCLNMVVNNDSVIIKHCLEAVKKWVDYWVIVDTGSTDGTQQLIRETLKDVPGELHERDHLDGAGNRNEALELAKNKADYLLLIDADRYLIEEESFVMPSLSADVYYAAFHTSSEISYQEFLINSSLDWTWNGALYEKISSRQSKTGETLNNICIIPMMVNIPLDKHLRDASLLEKSLQDDPTDARSVYYLALTYVMAQKYEQALENYEKRAAMGGDPEEVFNSLLAIGTLQEKLQMNPELFIGSYNKAFQYRPSRAEPLYCMAKYYIANKSHLLGYLLAQYALTIPYPADRGAVGFSVYEFELLLQFAECSNALGRVEETCSAYRQLIPRFEGYLSKRYCSKPMKESITAVLPVMQQYLTDNQSKKSSTPAP